MHLKGRLRRLLSASEKGGTTGGQQLAGRASDVSESSNTSYDRSSGSIIHRVTTSFKSRHARSRRSMSESEAGNSFALDIPSLYPDHAASQDQISALNDEAYEYGQREEKRVLDVAPLRRNLSQPIVFNRSALASVEESNSWEDGPSPQELQKSQDIVSAWLDTSMPCGPPLSSSLNSNHYPEVVYEAVEEEAEEEQEQEEDGVPFPPRRALRMLDSISEDEVPEFVGSTVSTAPSTPMFPHIDRSRSYSPPPRRRSLEGQEEYPTMRALDTIDETTSMGERYPPSPRRSLENSRPLVLESISETTSMGERYPPSPRRSLENSRSLVLESIPEVEPTTSLLPPKRRLGIKGFGLPRSESAPVIPIKSTFATTTGGSGSGRLGLGGGSNRHLKLPLPSSNLHLSIRSTATSPGGSPRMKGTTTATANGMMSSPSPAFNSFQRGTGLLAMSQQQQQQSQSQRSSRSSGGSRRGVDALPPPLLLPRASASTSTSTSTSTSASALVPKSRYSPTMHSLGSIAAQTEEIEDEESRRLTETAFLL